MSWRDEKGDFGTPVLVQPLAWSRKAEKVSGVR